jgi:hypothetical protein
LQDFVFACDFETEQVQTLLKLLLLYEFGVLAGLCVNPKLIIEPSHFKLICLKHLLSNVELQFNWLDDPAVEVVSEQLLVCLAV